MKKENEIQKVGGTTKQETAVTMLEVSDGILENFKSLYYMLNASPDTQMQILNDDKVVTLHDIYVLNERVNEKLKTHNIVAISVSIDVSFNDGKSKNYKNWEEFLRTNWNITSTTKSVSLIWDFYIKLPLYEIPQRHSLKIRIGSQLRPDEIIKVMLESETDSQFDSLMANVVCKVDFVNTVICDELTYLVKEWYGTLQKDYSKRKIIVFYKRYANRISKLIDMSFPVIMILLIYGWTSRYLDSHNSFGINSANDIKKTLLWLTCSILLVYCSKYLGFIVASINYKKAKNFTDFSNVYITKGDNNKKEEAVHKNRSIIRDITINLVATCIFSILAFIWGILL